MAVEPGNRVMASILKISSIKNMIKFHDKVILEFEGCSYKNVVKKGEYEIGELVVYMCNDSVPDFDNENFKFFKNEKKFKCIKTKFFNDNEKVLSEGCVFKITILEGLCDIVEGLNVTDILKIKKYVNNEEKKLYVNVNKDLSKPFPKDIVEVSDEVRLNGKLEFLDKIINRKIIITRKEDGMSSSYIYINGEYKICSRNTEFLKGHTESKNFYKIDKMYNLENKLRELNRNICIRGELVGYKIQGNKLEYPKDTIDIKVYNIYDIDNKRYLSNFEVDEICKNLGLNQVPIIYKGNSSDLILKISENETDTFGNLSKDMKNNIKKIFIGFQNISNETKYSENNNGEGIVVKTDDYDLDRVSFKLLSENFKH